MREDYALEETHLRLNSPPLRTTFASNLAQTFQFCWATSLDPRNYFWLVNMKKKTEEKIVRTVPTNSWFEQYCPWTSVTVSSIPRQGFGLSPIWELPGNWGAVYTNIEEEKTKHYGFFCIFFLYLWRWSLNFHYIAFDPP